MIIDFHAHTFPDKIAANTLDHLSSLSKSRYFAKGTLSDLLIKMKEAGIDRSVNLPVATNLAQVEKLNSAFIEKSQSLYDMGIIPFGAMHPDFENPEKEIKRLKEAGIKGIKLHPAYQGVPFDDIRFLRIMDAAESHEMIVLIHAGIDIGIPGRDYADVNAILNVIKEISPARLVLAHMGGWGCWKAVEEYLCGAPVYMDTAFSIGKISWNNPSDTHPDVKENMSVSDFERLVKKHGPHRILFATDTPWADIKEYVGYIKKASSLTDGEKAMILGDNAEGLLN